MRLLARIRELWRRFLDLLVVAEIQRVQLENETRRHFARQLDEAARELPLNKGVQMPPAASVDDHTAQQRLVYLLEVSKWSDLSDEEIDWLQTSELIDRTDEQFDHIQQLTLRRAQLRALQQLPAGFIASDELVHAGDATETSLASSPGDHR